MRGEFVEVEGKALYYYASGTRESGSTIVLLHGLLTSGHLWGPVVSLLPKKHRVVVVDLAGHGRSQATTASAAGLSIGEHAHLVRLLLGRLGVRRALLVGHGAGASIAMHLAVPPLARYALLVSPVDGTSGPELRVRKFARVLRVLPVGASLAVARAALLAGYSDPTRGRHSVDMYLRPLSDFAGQKFLLSQVRAMDRESWRGMLSLVVPHAAIVWGTDDPFVSRQSVERLRRSLPQSTLVEVDRGRHFLSEESPERIVEVISGLLDSSLESHLRAASPEPEEA